MRALVLIVFLFATAEAQADLKCQATMCADGSHVKCCGSNCCPQPKASGGGGEGAGYNDMFMNQMWNMVLTNQQRYNEQAARNLQMRRQAAQQALLERERQRLEKERLVLEERKRVLRNMKGVQLSDGPLQMKAVGGDTGNADPWCFENPPKSDCDADWERRCGDGSRRCRVVEIPKDQDHWFDAQIGNVVGPVFVKRSGTRWIKLEKGGKLHGGDVLRTGNGGSVSITTFDGYFESEATVGANSEFAVQERDRSHFGRAARFIKKGLVRFKVRCTQKGLETCMGHREFNIRTPVAVTSVRGTTFQIGVAENGASSVLLHEGGVEAAAAELQAPTEDWFEAAMKSVGEASRQILTERTGRAIRLADNSVAAVAPESHLSMTDVCWIKEGSVIITYTGKKDAGAPICRTSRGVVSALESDAVFQLSAAQEGLPLLRVYSGTVLLTVEKE